MRIIVFITLSILLTSCAKWRERQKLKYQSTIVENHYRDSVHTFERETIREQFTNADTTNARFNLDSLLKAGTLKSTDRYFTTEIRYLDNDLFVTTTIDSLMSRIRTLERSFSATQVAEETIEEVNKEVESKKVNTFSGWVFVGLGVLFVLMFFLYWRLSEKFKNQTPSE